MDSIKYIEICNKYLNLFPHRVKISDNRVNMYFKNTNCSYSKDDIINILMRNLNV